MNIFKKFDLGGSSSVTFPKDMLSAIEEELNKHGFIIINSSAVNTTDIKSLFKLFKEFCKLPVEEKRMYCLNEGILRKNYDHNHIGYVEPLRTNVRNFMGSQDGLNDYWERLSTNKWVFNDDHETKKIFQNSKIGKELYEIMKYVYVQFEATSNIILSMFEQLLELPPLFFADNTSLANDALTVQRYPRSQDSLNNNGLGIHTDDSLFTFIMADSPGVYVEVSPNVWEEPTLSDGDILVNVGDLLSILTSGLYKSTPHKILLQEHERLACSFFKLLNHDYLLKPVGKFGHIENNNVKTYLEHTNDKWRTQRLEEFKV